MQNVSLYEIPFTFIYIYINGLKKILTALKCAISSMMCRGSVMDVVGTFNLLEVNFDIQNFSTYFM